MPLADIKMSVRLRENVPAGSKTVTVSLVASDVDGKELSFHLVTGLLQLAPNLWFSVDENTYNITDVLNGSTPNIYDLILTNPTITPLSKGREYAVRTRN